MKDITENRHGGNDQSSAAHKRRRHGSEGHRAQVFRWVRFCPDGVTCDELAEKWGVGMNSVSGRFSELHRDGKIERRQDDHGKTITRPTRTGGRAAVWFAI